MISLCAGDRFDISLCLGVVGTATTLAFLLLALPLGTYSSINKPAFVINQVLYCISGFNLMRYNFEFTLPGLSVHVYRTLHVINVACTILYYFVIFLMNIPIDTTTKTIPPLFATITVIGYLIHAYQQDDPEVRKAEAHVMCAESTISPLRSRMSLSGHSKKELKAGSLEISEVSTTSSLPRTNPSDGPPLSSWPFLWNDFLGFSPSFSELEGVTVIGSEMLQWCRSLLMASG